MTTIEERVRSILENVKIEAQSWDAMNGYSMRPNRKTDYIGETTTELLSLITDEKIAENQMYLDRINNYVPDPAAPRYGSASGAIEVQGFKGAFESRIAELKDQRRGK